MKRPNKYDILGRIGKVLIFIPLALTFAVVSITSDYQITPYVKKGDMNADGIISSTDINIIMGYSANQTAEISDLDFKRADMDNDGFITAKDAYLANAQISSSVIIKYDEETFSSLSFKSFAVSVDKIRN